jgi:aspartate/methionine/tyrosine aminotransferase
VTPKTKVIIFNSPHNPTGMMIPEADQRKLFEIAEKNDSYILSDEIYDRLVYGDVKHFSIGSLEETVNRIITVNGFGKSHAITGWRIGYAIIPQSLMGKVTKLQQHINTNTCTFVQVGACSIYKNEPVHIAPFVKELEERINYFDTELNKLDYITGVKPKAGFFGFSGFFFIMYFWYLMPTCSLNPILTVSSIRS